jgi:hypothetical protein
VLTSNEILSFLGAIHWGLEYAGYGGYHSYKRFAIGVAMPAIAWPTMLMPLEYALITQFVAFTGLYFADARATVRGWAPPWYSTYRFVLTFIVGASIVLSLVGRGEISYHGGPMPGPAAKMSALRDMQREAAIEEEGLKQKRLEAQAKKVANDEKPADEDEDENEGEDKEKDGE